MELKLLYGQRCDRPTTVMMGIWMKGGSVPGQRDVQAPVIAAQIHMDMGADRLTE